MNEETGVVHVAPDDMTDQDWQKHVEREKLVPLPSNRKQRRAAAALARRSSLVRGKAKPRS